MNKVYFSTIVGFLTVLAAGALPKIESGPSVPKQIEAAPLPKGWISAPQGCFDPKSNIACDGNRPYLIEGTNIRVYGGLGWHFFDPPNNDRKREIYGIWIEENGARTITELAVPVAAVPENLREGGLADQVEWNPRTRLITIRLGESKFVYRLPAD